jgi:PAS domain S-box-containing protein
MIDMRTVLLSYAISNAICAVVVAFLWFQNRKRLAGTGYWLADYVLQFMALGLVALRGSIPDFMSIILSNGLIIGGTVLLLIGLERFVDKRTSQIHNYIFLAAFLVVHSYFTFVQTSLLARNINLSLGLVFICAQCAWLLIRRADAETLPTTRGVGYVFLAFCLFFLARILLDLVVDPGNDLFASGIFDTFLVLVNQMLFIVLTFGLLLMVNRRLVLDLERDILVRGQAEAALRLSEEKFFKAFHSSPDAILISRARDGRLVDVNEGFSRISGYSSEEALSSSSINLGLWVNPQDRDEFLAALRERNHVDNIEYDFRAKSGQILNCLCSGEIIELGGEMHVLTVVRDITRRKLVDAALRESEGRYRSLFENMLDGYAYCKLIYEAGAPRDFIYLEVNKSFEKLTGLQNVSGKRISEVIPGIRESNPELFEIYGRVASTGKPEEFETYLDTLGMWFAVSVYSPETEHFVAVFENITGRKRMDQALRHQNDVLATLNQVTLDLVNRHDLDDILQTLLLKISSLLGAPQISVDLVEKEDLLVTYAATPGQPLQVGDTMRRGKGGWLSWQAVDTGKSAILKDYSTWPERRKLYEGHPIHAIMVVPIHRRDRVIGAINVSRSEADKPFDDTDIYVAEQLAQMTALILDNAQLYAQLQSELAERIRNEEALRATQAELVAQQRTVAVYEDRQHLARDLHDSLSQSIHSLVLFSETLVATIDKNNLERAKQIVERLQESAWQSHKETRLMLYELQASGPGRSVDLIRDLEERLAKVERHTGVKSQIVQEGSMEYCPPEWHENLYWIVIEALNNALKHAQARKVRIVIRPGPQRLELEVSDNGRGYDTDKARAGGMGLDNMRARAELLGGRLTIESNPQKGTCVHFSAEIKEK